MKTWSNEQLAILDSEYPTADLKELAGRLGKTPEAVKFARREGLESG